MRYLGGSWPESIDLRLHLRHTPELRFELSMIRVGEALDPDQASEELLHVVRSTLEAAPIEQQRIVSELIETGPETTMLVDAVLETIFEHLNALRVRWLSRLWPLQMAVTTLVADASHPGRAPS